MHDCPVCGLACDCDCEDTWHDEVDPGICTCNHDGSGLDENGNAEDDYPVEDD